MPRRRTVSDVMTAHVHVAGTQTPFKLLVRLIEENHVSAIPIVDQHGIPIGIVSESDLLLKERRSELDGEQDLLHARRRRELRAKADGLLAGDLMTSPPITVPATIGLAQAARLMQEQNVRRLVVVDGRGKIAGIVSRSDLLQVFLRSDEELRQEVMEVLIPALMLEPPADLRVDVRWNVVTLTGVLDRKSDVEILTRTAAELDGVVGVVDRLTYLWDDSTATASPPQERVPTAI
jgi:CBS domain-containing protein